MENEKIKKVNPDENEVLETSGGEMPDPLKKMSEKAADAAQAFENPRNPKLDPKKDEKQTPDQLPDEQKKAG